MFSLVRSTPPFPKLVLFSRKVNQFTFLNFSFLKGILTKVLFCYLPFQFLSLELLKGWH